LIGVSAIHDGFPLALWLSPCRLVPVGAPGQRCPATYPWRAALRQHGMNGVDCFGCRLSPFGQSQVKTMDWPANWRPGCTLSGTPKRPGHKAQSPHMAGLWLDDGEAVCCPGWIQAPSRIRTASGPDRQPCACWYFNPHSLVTPSPRKAPGSEPG